MLLIFGDWAQDLGEGGFVDEEAVGSFDFPGGGSWAASADRVVPEKQLVLYAFGPLEGEDADSGIYSHQPPDQPHAGEPPVGWVKEERYEIVHLSAGPETQSMNMSSQTVPEPDSPASPPGEDHLADDLFGLKNPGIQLGIMIPSRTNPLFADGYDAMDDFLIIFRILENNDVPYPFLPAAVRFHGQGVTIPENRFHAPAGVGDGLELQRKSARIHSAPFIRSSPPP